MTAKRKRTHAHVVVDAPLSSYGGRELVRCDLCGSLFLRDEKKIEASK